MNTDCDQMTKEDRKRAVLRFLTETNAALLPGSIYLNMHDRGATFSENTTKRHLYEMEDEGLVEKPFEGKDHYRVTDLGRRVARGELDFDDLNGE